jgi:hypothetical protein
MRLVTEPAINLRHGARLLGRHQRLADFLVADHVTRAHDHGAAPVDTDVNQTQEPQAGLDLRQTP